MSEYIFGDVEGVHDGQLFDNRRALHDAGIHGQLRAGIWGKGSEGACSIVLSGGYVDDIDDLDQILYTGDSGRDPNSGLQINDQTLSPGNSGLIKSYNDNLPVRVTRGYQTALGPEEGYRYDGLYIVSSYEFIKGKDGFKVYQFNLISLNTYVYIKKSAKNNVKKDLKWPSRTNIAINRINRDKNVTKAVKAYYKDTCQVCCEPVIGKRNGLISIGAHIEPLGYPHNGPDVESNMLCLCPNHHTSFDDYGFTINEDLSINIDSDLKFNPTKILKMHPKHKLDTQYLLNHLNRAKGY